MIFSLKCRVTYFTNETTLHVLVPNHVLIEYFSKMIDRKNKKTGKPINELIIVTFQDMQLDTRDKQIASIRPRRTLIGFLPLSASVSFL